MRQGSRLLTAVLALGVALAPIASRASVPETVIKLAVLAPRAPQLVIEMKRQNQRLAAITGGRVSIRVYWGGSAGDERDVLRKMRKAQIDASVFTLPVVSDFVREALVLESPALCLRYEQLDALRAKLVPSFDAEAYQNQMKILAWGDFGKLRYYSKQRIEVPGDFRRTRPWKYPESQVLTELYRIIGANGVPLEIAEVYGALETGMIDTFWGTSLLTTLLQWQRSAKYVSLPFGFINGALVLRRGVWDALPGDVQSGIAAMIAEDTLQLQRGFRAQDESAHARLLSRGYEEVLLRDELAWWKLGHRLRERLVGRAYTRQLVEAAEAIALKHADPRQLAAFARR
jgi:TRAP-type C4-dicarboxylate transport system substrate-binding protein